MKILILANDDSGLYKFRKELINALLMQDHEVFISAPQGEYVNYFEDMGCTFIDTAVDRRGVNPINDYNLFMAYRTIIKNFDPDLIITYTIKPNIYGGIAASLAKKYYAVNVTGLGSAFEKRGYVRTIVVNLYKLAFKNAKVVFFENSSNRDTLVSLGCCNNKQTVVLKGAGVNTEEYCYLPYPKNEVVKFLFIGRIMHEKGIDELFEAMKRLISDGEKCFLDVVGSLEEDCYKGIIENYEAEGWLKYHGFQNDVKQFISKCDCFVLPSYHEGMANTNLECAASGRPIITSNIAGCREAVISGISGYLCESKKSDSLYHSMKKMALLSAEQREVMGLAGRKHMENIFDKKEVVVETIEALGI